MPEEEFEQQIGGNPPIVSAPAERQACEIRLRAERRWGQLYKDSEKAQASGSNQHGEVSREATSPDRLSDMGVSYDQSSRWQGLADIDEEAQAMIAEKSLTVRGRSVRPLICRHSTK